MLRILLLIFLLLPQLVLAADMPPPPTMQGGSVQPGGMSGGPPGPGAIGSDTVSQMQGEGGINLGMFTPPRGDMSMAYLADIFGVVDGVLHGSGSQIIGTVFGVFNSAVLMLGAIVLIYIFFVSTINTAQEGEVMGKNWSSVWVPLKAVTGFALLIPKASGYCFIQIFVMWVVVQGIGAADTVWNAALNYLARGGTIIQASNPQANVSNPAIINPVGGNIFKSLVCMYAVESALNNNAPANTNYPPFITSLAVKGTTTNLYPPTYCTKCSSDGACIGPNCGGCDCTAQLNFPGNVGPVRNGVNQGWDPTGEGPNQRNNYVGTCGNVTWMLGGDAGGGLAGSPNQIANPSNQGASDSRSLAVNQMVSSLEPLAQTVAYIMVPAGDKPSGNTAANVLSNRNDLAGAAVDYMGIMLPYLTQQAVGANSDALNLIAAQRNSGWILAGAYYYQLAQLNKSYTASETAIPTATFAANFAQCDSQPDSLLCKAAQPYLLVFQSYLVNDTVSCSGDKSAGQKPNDIDNFICYNMDPNNLPAASPGSTGSPFDVSGLKTAMIAIGVTGLAFFSMIGPLASVIILILGATLDIMNHVNALGDTTVDPLLAISSLGNTLVKWTEVLWVGGTLTVFITSVVGSIGLCLNPLGMAITTSLLWFLPMLMVILIAMFTAGAVMAYYVPLIPFILFLFTTIGWFAAVIESMIAAPLVAVGITHPEGHPILGKADPAVMLLANVFMRPTLIILGFLFGIILSHVALWLLNQGFAVVLPQEPHDLVAFVSIIIVIVIYVSIVMSVVNRSFALIHEVPNRVMRWLGQGVEQFGEESGARDVHGAAEQTAKTAAGGMETGGSRFGQERGGEVGAGLKQRKSAGTLQTKVEAEKPDSDEKPSGPSGGGGSSSAST